MTGVDGPTTQTRRAALGFPCAPAANQARERLSFGVKLGLYMPQA